MISPGWFDKGKGKKPRFGNEMGHFGVPRGKRGVRKTQGERKGNVFIKSQHKEKKRISVFRRGKRNQKKVISTVTGEREKGGRFLPRGRKKGRLVYGIEKRKKQGLNAEKEQSFLRLRDKKEKR